MKALRVLAISVLLLCLASCGGGGDPSPSAADLYQKTGKGAFVGDFGISNFQISPNPANPGEVISLTYSGTFTGQVAPSRQSFGLTLWVEYDGYSGATLFTQDFLLANGKPEDGVFHANGAAALLAPSTSGTIHFKIRLNPGAEGAPFIGQPAEADADLVIR